MPDGFLVRRRFALAGIRLHQRLSFSRPFLTASGGGDAAFFPGCSMVAANPDLTARVWNWLKKADPRMGAVSGCCGHPSLFSARPEKFGEYQRRLGALLAERGLKKLVVCCPNCRNTLRSLPGVEVVPLWPLLDGQKEWKAAGGATWVLHDPCPARNDEATLDSFRRVMRRAGVEFEEYPSNRGRALCCGKRGMTMYLDPGAGLKMLTRRVAESPNRNVLTFCFSCADSFRRAGCASVHGLELLFPAPSDRPDAKGAAWANRWKFARAVAAEERRRKKSFRRGLPRAEGTGRA